MLQVPDKGALMTWYDAELSSRLHAAFVRHPFVDLEYAIPLERCDEALPVWERFLELEPSSNHANTAQRAIALCRMRIQQDRAQTG